MKEDWDIKTIQESREENFENRETNPYRNTAFFFGFDIMFKNAESYHSDMKKKGNKRIYSYGRQKSG